MSVSPQFFVARFSFLALEFYVQKNVDTGLEDGAISSPFAGLSLSELAVAATENRVAMNVLLQKMSEVIQSFAFTAKQQNRNIQVDELCDKLRKLVVSLVFKFDPEVADFENYCNSSMKRYIDFEICHVQRKNYTNIKYFGIRVPESQAMYFYDSAGEDFHNSILSKIDFETFRDNLQGKEKEVFILKSNGLNYREISEALGMGISTVNSVLKRLKKKAEMEYEREKELNKNRN